MKRRLAPSLLTLAIVLAVLEVASFAFFSLARDRFSFADPSLYVLDPARVQGLQSHFDATLGWTNRYPTPYEERPQPVRHGQALMATFGDSYTHCDEVENVETWQAYLAEMIGADVYNFGVGGYGPDQALLRYRLKSHELETPLVALGVALENINRIVNRYRPFYYRETGIPLTKPRFVLRDGSLVLLPNPLTRPSEVSRLTDPAFVHGIGAEDFWYAHAGLPRLGFPYARLLLSPSLWRQALEGGRPRGSELDERPARNLWKDEGTRALFLAIVDAFASEVTAAGARPLILILPGRPHVESRRAQRGIPGFESVRRHCVAKGYACLDGIGVLAQSGETAEVQFRPGGHLSPLGNRTLARALAAWLDSSGARERIRGGC